MPKAYGRDRLEERPDGTLALSSLRDKGWSGRDESGPVPRPGAAVRWDDTLFEVVSVEPTASGGHRYTLAPWDDRLLVRGAISEYGPDAGPGTSTLPAATPRPVAARRDRRGWASLPEPARLLLVGLAPTALLWWFFPVRVMGEGMSFLVHEGGHTVAAWLLGCFALPAVVMTLTFEQNRAAAALVWAGLGALAWRCRRAYGWNVILGVLVALYPVIAFTRLHLDAISLAGHGAEAVGVAVLFWRALRGGLFAEWERPVSSMLAWWVWIRNLRLFGGIVVSPEMRTDYLTVAITGENDLVTVAKALGTPLPALAAVCFVATLLVPLAAIAVSWRPREKT